MHEQEYWNVLKWEMSKFIDHFSTCPPAILQVKNLSNLNCALGFVSTLLAQYKKVPVHTNAYIFVYTYCSIFLADRRYVTISHRRLLAAD